MMAKALKWFLGLGITLFIVSCAESDKDRLSRLVKEWEGKEILFPVHSIFTIQGKDTVDFTFQEADYKVVTYIDSVGCTGCKLQLSRWKALVAEVGSMTDGRVPFLFYFHPKDMKELRFLTRRDDFKHPVCFDENDEFNSLNHFPTEMTFQTFLLDKANKVVAIGNPVHNPQIKDLYLEIITGKSETTPKQVVTTVSVDQTEKDFGKFSYSQKQEYTFLLTNTGNSVLAVQDVITSCGCTKAEYRKEPVRPGDTLEVKVIYEADAAGYFDKVVTIYCNAENSPISLRVKGFAQ